MSLYAHFTNISFQILGTVIDGQGAPPMAGLLLSILFWKQLSGLTYPPVAKFLSFNGIGFVTEDTFFKHQGIFYSRRAIEKSYKDMQNEIITALQAKPVLVGGDTRYDSPGNLHIHTLYYAPHVNTFFTAYKISISTSSSLTLYSTPITILEMSYNTELVQSMCRMHKPFLSTQKIMFTVKAFFVFLQDFGSVKE